MANTLYKLNVHYGLKIVKPETCAAVIAQPQVKTSIFKPYILMMSRIIKSIISKPSNN